MGQETVLTDTIVVMGRIGAPFGVKGWVHVHSYTEPADSILSYRTWCLKIKGQWEVTSVLEARAQGKHFVAVLAGSETRDAAALLTNLEVGIPREALPILENDEYYWTDLIGMSVVTDTGVSLGVVESLFETGANDVLVVKGETREYLIPYVPVDYVLEINVETRVMRVLWDPEF
jgi:16S rRNA processing protein RimM